MDQAPVVSVRGEALLEVDPEVATLTIGVGARDKDRDTTLAALDRRSQAVTALLDSFGAAVERVETTGLRISPEFKDNKPNEKVTGYAGAIRHSAVVADFTRLGDLVARLAEQELVDVAGPWWSLRRDSHVFKDARVAAAQQALTRAREYAEALGSRVVGLLELADVGLLGEHSPVPLAGGGPPPPGMAPAPAGMRAAGAPPPPPSFELEPVRQVVRAAVEARFLMGPVAL